MFIHEHPSPPRFPAPPHVQQNPLTSQATNTMSTKENLAVALELAQAGIPVFPARFIRRFNGWEKKPAINDWQTLASTDLGRIQSWWAEFPYAVAAIEMGGAGLVAIDADRHRKGADGQEAYAQLVCDVGAPPPHPTTDTPSNGNHHFFRAPPDIEIGTSSGALPAGIDVRGRGGLVIAPGAVRPDGVVYSSAKDSPRLADAYRDGTIPVLPEAFVRLITSAHRGNGKEIPAGEAAPEAKPAAEPVAVELELANMAPGIVNATQCRVMGSLLSRGVAYQEIADTVIDATMRMATAQGLADWTREEEVTYVGRRMSSILNTRCREDTTAITGDPPPAWVAPELLPAWNETIRNGGRPNIVWRKGSGWYVRDTSRLWRDDPRASAQTDPNNKDKADSAGSSNNTGKSADEAKAEKPILRLPLFTWRYIDPATLPPRQYLYGKHYQRGIVSATVAPGGTGKTSLGTVEGLAMVTCRNLLNEQPIERCRVWIHNGEDDLRELQRRILAACQLFKIPQEELKDWLYLTSGEELPLRVARGYNELKIDTELVERMTATILELEIDVVLLDPLITLHGVREDDNPRMDTVIRLFKQIASHCDCAIDICHHTRKLPAGSNGADYIADDARGASAFHDAVRMLRLLNVMSREEAKRLSIDEFERLSYFRVDRGKGNTIKPSAANTVWRKFESVVTANGEEVGVVTAWNHPGEGPPSDRQKAASEAAEICFLTLLDRFTAIGRNISDRGPYNAPLLFAKEPEAKKAKLGKDALAEAMRRLFATNKIRVENYGKPSHPLCRIVRT